MNAENPYSNATQLPQDYDGEYGDGFLVGTGTPYELYIWSRNNTDTGGFWFDWGLLNAPSIVPGPPGQDSTVPGPKGDPGTKWTVSTTRPGVPTTALQGDIALVTGGEYIGNVYTYNGSNWAYSGNIRGPQGPQGNPGTDGKQGIQGPIGPVGPQGPMGQFLQIAGTDFTSTDQLPDPATTPRANAYVIGTDLYAIVGTTTLAWEKIGTVDINPSEIVVDGVSQSSVNLSNVPTINGSIQIGEDTTVSSNGSEITFIDLQTTSTNVNGTTIEGTTTLELPIAAGEYIKPVEDNNVIKFDFTDKFGDDLQEVIMTAVEQAGGGSGPIVTISGNATSGQITSQSDKDALVKNNCLVVLNNEVYRMQDNQYDTGFLIYSHTGYSLGSNDENEGVYGLVTKIFAVMLDGWQWQKLDIPSGGGGLYQHNISLRFNRLNSKSSWGYINFSFICNISSRFTSSTSMCQAFYTNKGYSGPQPATGLFYFYDPLGVPGVNMPTKKWYMIVGVSSGSSSTLSLQLLPLSDLDSNTASTGSGMNAPYTWSWTMTPSSNVSIIFDDSVSNFNVD